MKKFEVIQTTGVQHRLTITPDRITVKIMNQVGEEEAKRVTDFALFAAEKMGDVTQSWRGQIDIHRKEGNPPLITTSLKTNNKRCKRVFDLLNREDRASSESSPCPECFSCNCNGECMGE